MSTPSDPETHIKPLGDHVAVVPDSADKISKSGIIIPDSAQKEAPQEGILVALGNGGIDKDCANPSDFLEVGDKVIFGKYVGDDVVVQDACGEDIIVKILHLDSILGKVS